MPQLDIATFPPQLIWLAITFLILYALMAWLALPRVGGIIAARRTRIDGDLEKANAMKAETDAVIAAYERALAQARQQAMATLKETTDKLNAQASDRQRAVAEKLAAETAAAERRILGVKNAALGDLRGIALDVARFAAAKLGGENIDELHAAAAVDRAMRERG
jgi:F-type H+-transporting ATPase subunit b